MDPLSVTASVIAVIQLTSKVITLCLDLHASIKGRKELDQIIDEVDSLRSTLQRLARQRALQVSDSDSPQIVSHNRDHDSTLSLCHTELESLHIELGKAKSSDSRFGIQAVTWMLKGRELENRLSRLSRAKATLQLSISLDQTDLLIQSRMDSLKIRTAMDETNLEQQRRSIVDWLGPPFPTSAYNDAQKQRSGSTGDWFLHGEAFRDWKLSPKSTLWISGIPGSGKTILCSSIIEDLGHWCQSESDRVLLYFFFDFTTRDKSMVGLFLRVMLAQIMIQRREIPEPIVTLFEQHHSGFQQPSVKTLLETLDRSVADLGQVYLVVDALDECNDRQDLLGTLEDITEWRMSNLHILATSRPEKDIEELFLGMKCQQLRLEGPNVRSDIRHFIDQKMLKERWLKKWPQEMQSEIMHVVATKAGSMFRLATLQLDRLRSCRTPRALRQALYSLPTTLDETYSRILQEIEPDHAEDARKILSFLCFCFKPPTLSEVAEALAVNTDTCEYDAAQKLQDTEDVLTICGSLVLRGTDSMGIIKLSHYSVKEYLMSERILDGKNGAFRVTEAAADTYLAKTCLVYLLSRPYRSRDELNSSISRDPLTLYATDFWSAHFFHSQNDPNVMHLARKLFLNEESYFVDWAWFATFLPEGFHSEWPNGNRADTFLYYSTLLRSTNLINAMLDNGANINTLSGACGAPLAISAYLRDLPSLRLLLSRGADVNLQGPRLRNALQATICYGWGGIYQTALNNAMHPRRGEEAVTVPIESGSEIPDIDGDCNKNPLLKAGADQERLFIARLLLDYGADPNRGPCLQGALLQGYEDLADLLLERGAKVNAYEVTGGSPIGAAAQNGLPMLRFLIDKWDADYHWRDPEGRTVLHIAARSGSLETLEYLLDRGMDVHQLDKKGWSAVHYASEADTPDKLDLLLSRTPMDGLPPVSSIWTPLHLACKRNQPKALDILIRAGYQPSMVTTNEPFWEWDLYDIAITHRNHHLISAELEPIHPLLVQTRTHRQRPPMQPTLTRRCDGCCVAFEEYCIFGPVFHCKECPDFDYCFMCKVAAEESHPHSSWEILSSIPQAQSKRGREDSMPVQWS